MLPKILKFTKCLTMVVTLSIVATAAFAVTPALTLDPLSWIVAALCIVIGVTSFLACFAVVASVYGQD
jgi:hypothetical protein